MRLDTRLIGFGGGDEGGTKTIATFLAIGAVGVIVWILALYGLYRLFT